MELYIYMCKNRNASSSMSVSLGCHMSPLTVFGCRSFYFSRITSNAILAGTCAALSLVYRSKEWYRLLVVSVTTIGRVFIQGRRNNWTNEEGIRNTKGQRINAEDQNM